MFGKFGLVPGLKMHKTAMSLARFVEKNLMRSLDLSLPQFMLLAAVANKDECSQVDVAKARGLTEAAISRMVDGLVKRNLILKKKNPENRRQQLLELTKEGEEMMEKGLNISKTVIDQVLSRLTENERMTLDEIMDKIIGSIKEETQAYA